MVLKEAIAYYVSSGSTVFCTFLDASKAFDRVQYCKLFRQLVDRDVPPVWLRLLANMYTNHSTQIAWNGICSTSFLVKNGVKQGGILSPVLFCVYLDGLLKLLEFSGVGCFIGRCFVGALAYADDIVLLAPTAGALRTMLSICDEYADDFDVIFNARKSRWLLMGRSAMTGPEPMFYINGKSIERVGEWLHLGHLITDDCNDDGDILFRNRTLCRQINDVLCYFKNRGSLITQKLLKSFCMSLYGCELWPLEQSKIGLISVSWRKGLRRAWKLPYNTHCSILPVLSSSLPLFDEICCRTIKFINKCLKSDSTLVKFVSNYGVFFGRSLSPIGRNVLSCCSRYNLSLFDIDALTSSFIANDFYAKLEEGLISRVLLLLELLFLRDGGGSLPGFTGEEIELFIQSLCTS
jgi:hypothetical protein